MSNWYRRRLNSDFSDPCFGVNSHGEMIVLPRRKVTFVNMSPWDAVKSLVITYYNPDDNLDNSGCLAIEIQLGAKVNPKIRQAILNWQKLQDDNRGIKFIEENPDLVDEFVEYHIDLQTIEAISQLPKLLRFINLELEEDLFSADILQEINAITTCSLEMRKCGRLEHTSFKHILPMLPEIRDYSNPNRSQSRELSELLYNNYTKGELSDDDFGQLQSLLAQGEDPNQFHPLFEDQPLDYAKHFRNTEIFEILLHYHANPFSLFGYYNKSTFEWAVLNHNTVIVNIIMGKFLQPERPVTLMIKNIDVAYQSSKIKTFIDWHRANDARKETVATVETELKRTVNDREEQEIIAWTNHTCALPNDPQQLRLTASVRRDLHKQNQVIEIIRNRGKMIGFNIFEILIPEEGNKIYLYCNLSLIGPEFRQTNMMPMLIKRVAEMLWYLNESKVIVLGYLAANFNSYRLADDLHWPKYQTEEMAKEARWFHHALHLDPDETYHHRGLASYVENQIMIKERAVPAKRNFQWRFFHTYLLDQGDTFNDTGHRAALIFSQVTNLFHLSLENNCERIGMNLGSHLQSLLYLMQMLLPDFSTKTRVNTSYSKARELFWLNCDVKSDKLVEHSSSKMRSKL